jgi:predicted PurR-regulated permease PerM
MDRYVYRVWTPRQVIAATLTILLVTAAFWAIYRFHYAVFMLLAAMMLRIAIKPGVEWLRARGLRQDFSIGIVFGSLGLVLIGLGAVIAPVLVEQSADIAKQLPQYYVQLRTLLVQSPSNALHQLAAGLPSDWLTLLPQPSWSAPRPSAALDSITPAAQFITNTSYGIFLLVATLMMTVYWTLDADRVTRALLMRVLPEKRESWRELITELEGKVGDYFRGQLILCGFIFVLSTLAFVLIGLPYALVLGLIAGVFEVLPMIGPLLGMLPAVLIALATSTIAGPQQVIWVVVAATVIQQIENNLLVPRVMNKSVGINPILSILAIAAFSLLFGWVGALLAIPVAAILQILIGRLLFNTSVEVEEQPVQPSTALPVRNKLSVLRLEARELAEDVRKQVRKPISVEMPLDTASDAPIEERQALIEDQIETMARDLDQLLAQAESAQPALPIAPARLHSPTGVPA